MRGQMAKKIKTISLHQIRCSELNMETSTGSWTCKDEEDYLFYKERIEQMEEDYKNLMGVK